MEEGERGCWREQCYQQALGMGMMGVPSGCGSTASLLHTRWRRRLHRCTLSSVRAGLRTPARDNLAPSHPPPPNPVQLSTKRSLPSFKLGTGPRFVSPEMREAMALPGPGAFNVPSTIGAQVASDASGVRMRGRPTTRRPTGPHLCGCSAYMAWAGGVWCCFKGACLLGLFAACFET